MLSEEFDKFKYYGQAVQSPDADAEFLSKTYQEIKGKKTNSYAEKTSVLHWRCSTENVVSG